MNSIMDLFKAETEIEVKAGELFGIMREATKAEFLLNAAKCDVPHTYARQIATGEKEDPEIIFAGVLDCRKEDQGVVPAAGDESGVPAAVPPVAAGADKDGGIHIIRKSDQAAAWRDIQWIVQSGHAPVSLPPGTEIKFALKNGDPTEAVVVGVDHYDKGDCVLWFRRIIARHCMNDDDVNEGGFRDCAARGYMNRDLFDLLPDDLAEIIVPHKTIQKIDGETLESEDRLFMPSEYEEKGANDWAEYNGIDKQFPYFEERRNRIAVDEDGDHCWYWTADPSSASTTTFCYFGADGYSNDANASSDGGIAPLFLIR